MPSYEPRAETFSRTGTRRKRSTPDVQPLVHPGGNQNEIEPTTKTGSLVPVSAVHIAQSIDLFPALSSVFTARGKARRHKIYGNNSFVAELSAPPHLHPSLYQPRYIAVFRFGSVVAFNVSPRELSLFVQAIKKEHSIQPVLSGFERKENYCVVVEEPPTPQTATPADETASAPDDPYFNFSLEDVQPVVTGDYCIVPALDINGAAVISNIMAQTVALDSYNDTVDGLLANFSKINSTVTETGNFSSTDKDSLFRSVAQNNSIFIEMISRVRIKDRSDTAWNMVKYERIHYGMKEEFEIDDRFEHIEFKLNLIQQNAKFFLEMVQNHKANSLEWIIVVLISVECVLMCVEMSGMGEPLFQSIMSWF